jgi:hypothetical protein
MISRKEMAWIWVFGFAYTAYVVGVVVGSLAVFSDAVGAPVGFALAVGPLIAGSIWAVGR